MKKVFIINGENIDFDLDKYTHLRAYHGARCLDESTYLRDGIHTFDRATLVDYVKNICHIAGVNEQDIMDVFDEKYEDTDDAPPKVWLSGTEESLLDGAGHYLIYGSEFVISLFAEAFHNFDVLKTVGVPTIFVCDIPIEDIGKRMWLPSIVDAIRRGDTNVGFPVYRVLPEDIVGIEHPTDIVDPYTQLMYHYNGKK
mgnify:FL=1